MSKLLVCMVQSLFSIIETVISLLIKTSTCFEPFRKGQIQCNVALIKSAKSYMKHHNSDENSELKTFSLLKSFEYRVVVVHLIEKLSLSVLLFVIEHFADSINLKGHQ